MGMTRRNFLRGMLAAAVAPAIVKAEHIMRIRPLESGLLVPDPELTIGTVRVYESHLGTWVVSDEEERILKQIEERTAAMEQDRREQLLKQIAERTAAAMEQDRREQLLEALYNISPAQTPFTSGLPSRAEVFCEDLRLRT